MDMHPIVTPSVHIVNPTLTTATAPSPPSMTMPSGVTYSPNDNQRFSPMISTNSAKQSSVSASNAANPAASANAAGAVAAAATGSTMSGLGSAGNAPGAALGARAAAGPGGRPISPSVLVVPNQNTRGHLQHKYIGLGHAAH